MNANLGFFGFQDFLSEANCKESSLKWHEWWLDYWQANASFVFKVGRGFEGMIILEGFKERMIFEHFEDRMIFEGGRSSFGCLLNLEEQ